MRILKKLWQKLFGKKELKRDESVLTPFFLPRLKKDYGKPVRWQKFRKNYNTGKVLPQFTLPNLDEEMRKFEEGFNYKPTKGNAMAKATVTKTKELPKNFGKMAAAKKAPIKKVMIKKKKC